MGGFKETNIYTFNPSAIPGDIFAPCIVFENPPPMKNSAKSGKEISILGISSKKLMRHTPPLSSTPVSASDCSYNSSSFKDNDRNGASVHDSSFQELLLSTQKKA